MSETTRVIDTIVIGAGQSGLAVAKALRGRAGLVVIDAGKRIGDSWRDHWDSLRLFTPAKHSALPGLRLDSSDVFPTKDEVATYLERYATSFNVAVKHEVTVTRISVSSDGYALETSDGDITARNVVVASGANAVQNIPDFANQLAPSVHQLHSSAYRNPTSVPDGPVLVVGAGTSGLQIAIELAATHSVTIAGRPTAQIPPGLLRRAGELYWFFIYKVLTKRTPIGRKAAAGFHDHGAPLIGVSVDDLDTAGVTRVGRVTGVEAGVPVIDDKPANGFASIVWATGYRADYRWIDGVPVDDHGWPETQRGVVTGMPGLYFVGLPFQYGLTSSLLGGVGRDAEYVAKRLVTSR
jgi:putative flavoprotein involved in K+ transport